MSTTKPIIAVDIDEVLAEFIPSLATYHNEHYGGETLTSDSFFSYDFHHVWGGTPQECTAKMELFFKSEEFEIHLPPIKGAFEILSEMKQYFDFHIVTARNGSLREVTTRWMDRHFPGIFSELHFGSLYSTTEQRRNKVEICKDIGAILLIDDALKYCLQCIEQHIPVLLFGNYAWNQLTGIEGFTKYEPHNSVENNMPMEVVLYVNHHEVSIHNFHPTVVSGQGLYGNMVDPALPLFNATKELIRPITTINRVKHWGDVQKALYQLLSHHIAPPKPTAQTLTTAEEIEEDALHVLVVQLCSINSKEENLATIRRLITSSSPQKGITTLVCLPENCLFFPNQAGEGPANAETIPSEGDPTDPEKQFGIHSICQLAKEFSVWISVGGMVTTLPEKADDMNTKFHNTHILINDQGELQYPVYHKIHLFDCPYMQLYESKRTAPGNELVVLSINQWKVALSICYDLRFPLLYHQLRYLHNCDIVLIPAAFTVPTGKAHWEILLRARAIESQCYVLAAAQSGIHSETRQSYGHSMIVDPWGAVIGSLLDESEGVLKATLSKTSILATRERMPIENHNRYDLYQNGGTNA